MPGVPLIGYGQAKQTQISFAASDQGFQCLLTNFNKTDFLN